jgi:hypothetical protein
MRASLQATGIVLAASWLAARPASADRYEATVSVRPIGGIGRVTEDIAVSGSASMPASQPMTATAYAGGGELGVGYGLRNWLDLDLELVGERFTQAIYDSARVSLMGTPTTGHLARTTSIAQLRAGATLRGGVGWVPTLHLGVGVGGRSLTAATLGDSGGADVTPDGMSASLSMDIVVLARAGIEHRLDRRWGVGVSVEASRAFGFGTSPIDAVSGGISLSYSWYPRVPW